MVSSMHSFQPCASKQNLAAPVLLKETGGSWKKSPVNTNWIPPNGLLLPRICFAISFSLSKKIESIIDSSSMIKTRVPFQRSTTALLLLILPTSLCTGSDPSPIPENRFKVVPSMLVAASPVDAVTAIVLEPYRFLSLLISSRSRNDLPVPAEPV
ncbi:hypothetical protein OGAPHI_004508 [Ogataea philodendri]|uniref:Uncharacterized protein n=1 Tax=Ogataea philodendri TaxID=1378263 RepID=A0A9P8T5I3_9ASCO|nr:uncharacterized protein OGAPHI_004508 [Ogataea philodendri]KAH3666319.1 hypothetical protein OGAPHI_004508 [Ogataea philodendri]